MTNREKVAAEAEMNKKWVSGAATIREKFRGNSFSFEQAQKKLKVPSEVDLTLLLQELISRDLCEPFERKGEVRFKITLPDSK